MPGWYLVKERSGKCQHGGLGLHIGGIFLHFSSLHFCFFNLLLLQRWEAAVPAGCCTVE